MTECTQRSIRAANKKNKELGEARDVPQIPPLPILNASLQAFIHKPQPFHKGKERRDYYFLIIKGSRQAIF